MNYLLSKEEYQDLLAKKKADELVEKEILQAFCSLAAKHIPAYRNWREEDKSPWGCSLKDGRVSGYCDNCPAQEICPHEYKSWSK